MNDWTALIEAAKIAGYAVSIVLGLWLRLTREELKEAKTEWAAEKKSLREEYTAEKETMRTAHEDEETELRQYNRELTDRLLSFAEQFAAAIKDASTNG